MPELDSTMAAIARANVQGLVVFPDALTIANRKQIADAALKAHLAAVSGWGEFVGPNLRVSYRRLATFVDKVLKGAVNTRTAQALGHEIPRAVVLRADRVVS